MAVCYGCGYKFRDETECPNCGRSVIYECWDCKATIDPEIEVKCRRCGWYICPECGKCGCDQERPPSKEENGEGWDYDD
jgi:hypothetical protein